MPRPKKDSTPADEATPQGPLPNAAANAFAKIEPRLAELSGAEPVASDLDVPGIVTTALAVVPRIRAYRADIANELPKHPIRDLDELDTYALGLWYAHLVHTYGGGSAEAVKALLDEATRLREGLLIAAEALAHRALLDREAVLKIRKGSGHADMASDLVALSSLFVSAWARVSSKTAVERHEVDRAAELGPAVLVALTAKKHADKPVEGADQRARALALLLGAYDTCRQALTYVRWKEGDVETIAPPLMAKRKAKKPSGKREEEAEGATGATVA